MISHPGTIIARFGRYEAIELLPQRERVRRWRAWDPYIERYVTIVDLADIDAAELFDRSRDLEDALIEWLGEDRVDSGSIADFYPGGESGGAYLVLPAPERSGVNVNTGSAVGAPRQSDRTVAATVESAPRLLSIFYGASLLLMGVIAGAVGGQLLGSGGESVVRDDGPRDYLARGLTADSPPQHTLTPTIRPTPQLANTPTPTSLLSNTPTPRPTPRRTDTPVVPPTPRWTGTPTIRPTPRHTSAPTRPPNRPPVISGSPRLNPQAVVAGQSMEVSIEVPVDPEGRAVTCRWLVDGVPLTPIGPCGGRWDKAIEGTHELTLEARGTDGMSAAKTWTLPVRAAQIRPTQPPAPRPTADPQQAAQQLVKNECLEFQDEANKRIISQHFICNCDVIKVEKRNGKFLVNFNRRCVAQGMEYPDPNPRVQIEMTCTEIGCVKSR